MPRLFFLLILCLFVQAGIASGPDALVKRSDVTYEILSDKKIQYTRKTEIVILNKAGDRFAQFAFEEDDFIKQRKFDIDVIVAGGKIMRSYDKKDFDQRLSEIRAGYYDDSQYFSIDVSQREYPYTIRLEQVRTQEVFFDYSWTPRSSMSYQYENFSFQFSRPADTEVRFYVDTALVERIQTEDKGVITDRFTLKHKVEAIDELYLKPEKRSLVHVVSNSFNYNGYRGSMESWTSFGKWMNDLWEKQSSLDLEAIAKVYPEGYEHLTSREKAEIAYDYIQSNMRYVAVTYGMGGLQTASAEETFEVGYGDCKALTNLLHTILAIVGVESFPALVSAGSGDVAIYPDRPTNNFNHVILCIPNQEDTLWAECTNQESPLNYLSDFTDDRYTMLMTPEGGVLTKTPSYTYKENLTIRTTDIIMGPSRSASISVRGEFAKLGMEESVLRAKGFGYEDEDIVGAMSRLSSFDVERLEVQNYPKDKPKMTAKIEIVDRLFAKKMGPKMLFTPFFVEDDFPFFEKEERKHPIYFRRGFTYVDTINVYFPDGMTLDKLPESRSLEAVFGGYEWRATLLENQEGVRFVRKLYYKEGEYPTDEYPEIKDFFDTVKNDENTKLALVPRG
jgi:hypothetical protein